MSSPIAPSQIPIAYSPQTVARAERALRCSPFKLLLFTTMRDRSVPLNEIVGSSGVERRHTQRPLLELVAESHLVWLIQVGLLRREVDGQGITDSFRLTPLGRQIVERYEKAGVKIPSDSLHAPLRASVWDRIVNALNRWLRLPF
ncbi:Npun_F0494 family protein [Oscillatoria sp. FACHB-1406]|uniref:Npun_F0494 family protein n=1 Tax=Oscillatoria sp. FACHB-1406 TaxID=2692846 RepID=UPI001685E8B0|nr:Npun_F0494 family protein [Oscillatoria sp. FACHB-1406]MBD2579201.1 hypothetical protein [Oscillatoria sp. FACHB-1406]